MSLLAQDLDFGYFSGVPVVRDVSMEVDPGEVVGLFGPNGSGKSTLLRCLNGALRPQTGQVLLDGRAVLDMSPREVATHIAVVPQDTPSEVPFTARQVVELGRYAHRAPWQTAHGDDLEVVDRCLSRVGVRDLAGRPFSQLSGGERQRVTIARALAQLGTYLLLDEPSAHLDIAHQIELYQLVRTVAAEGVGAVMVCHDLILSPLFVDRVILLKDGRIQGQGSPSAVLQSSAIAEAYGIPVDLTWTERQFCAIRIGSIR